MPASPDPRREAAERLGRNLAIARGRSGKSQSRVAAEMKAAGWSEWVQSTVHKSEHALRDVDFTEVQQLAIIYGTTLDRLTWLQGEDAEVAEADEAVIKIEKAWQDASDAVLRLQSAIAAGGRRAVKAGASKYKRARDAAAALEARAAALTVESAVADGLARHKDE
jgi:transcriptional regulator with XRE-family HTH domain